METRSSRDWAQLYVNEVICRYNPKFKIRDKSESRLFKFLSPIIKLINPRFFTDYITTLCGTMWVPPGFFNQDFRHVLQTVAHEGLHEYDKENMFPGLFELTYVFPQCLGIVAILLGIFCSPWFLFGMLFFAPIPAYGRYKLEMRAYRMQRVWEKYVWVNWSQYHDLSLDNVLFQMTRIDTYYWCWPFAAWIEDDFEKPLNELSPEYAHAVEFLKNHGIASKKV